MNAGTLSIELMANVARIADDMNRAQRTVGSAMGTIEKAAERAKAALGAIGFGLSAGALAAMVKGAIDAADGLKDLSKSTSVTISELSGLNLLAKQTGTDLGGIAKAINKMSVEIGKAPAEFKALGITATDNIGRFKQLADIFNGLENVTQRNALAQKIFGKSWEELAPALSEGSKGIADAVAKGQRLSGVTAEMADKADEFNDRLAELGIGMDGFKAGIATSLLPLLNQLTSDMQDVGDKAAVTSESFSPLAETFRALIILGGNVAFTFKGIGAEIGGVLAQMAGMARARNEFLSLNFKGAAAELRGTFGKGGIGDMMSADAASARAAFDAWEKKIVEVGTAAASTGKAIVAATKEEKAAADAAAKAAAAKAAAFLKTNEDALKKSAEAAKAEAKLLAELSGLSGDFAKNWADLSAVYAKGKINTEQLTKAQADLLAKQPAMKAAAEAVAKAEQDAAKFTKDYSEGLELLSKAQEKTIEDAIKEAEKNEELARTFGMTKGAIEQLELARLEEQLAQRASTGLTVDEIAQLEKLIDAKKRSATAATTLDQMEVAKKAADDAKAEWKRAAESIEQSLTDALMRGFESGKSFGRNLMDTLKNMFKTLVLQPTIKGILAPVSGMIGSAFSPGAAAATNSDGSSVAGSMASGLFGAGGMAGSLMAGAGWLTGASTLGGSLAAGASLVGTGTVAGGMAGAGMIVGALAPIALGIAAAVAIWKKLDTSGTYHTGGASSASSAGVSTIRAESLGFEATRTNADTEKMTAGLVTGIVSILDSTALAFGKTAGYTAATAFADDTSKDGAWGALLIGKLGEKIIDWQDTKSGNWAPKVFADGAAGQTQYLAALSASVRTALDGIGLPAWAQKMLDGLGDGASLENLSKVAEDINTTQRALTIMKGGLKGFAQLSDAATSSLMAASGGIEALAANASTYYDNFYTDGEKAASTIKQVAVTLAGVGLAMPATREAYREQLEAQMALGEAGAPAAAVMLKMSGAFAQAHPIINETANILGLQAQTYEALGDKVGAATILEKQHTLALVDLSPAMAEATKTLWAAQAAEKSRTERLAEASTILELQSQMYEANGDKAGAAAVLQQQHTAALIGLTPAVAAATQATWAAQAAEKARNEAQAIYNQQRGLDIGLLEAQGDAQGALAARRDDEIKALSKISSEMVVRQKQIYAAADAMEYATKARSLEIELLSAQGNAAGALALTRADEIEALRKISPALARMKQSVYDAADALAIKNSAHSLEIELLNAQGNAAGALAITRADELAALRKISPALVGMKQAVFDAADALAVKNSAHSLEIELLNAQGNSTAALAMTRRDELDSLARLSPALAASKQAIYDTADATKLASDKRALEIAIMQASGKEAMALAATRADELAAIRLTSPALAGLKQSLYDVQDAARISSERGGLQREMFQLQGDTAALRKLELEALDPSNRALKESIFALQDKMAADQAAAQAAAAAAAMAQQIAQAQAQAQAQAAEDQRRAVEEQVRAAEQLKNAWQGITTSIFDEVARIRGLITGGDANSLSDAQTKFAIATAQARSGDQEAARLLPQLSQAMLQIADATAITALDLRRIQAQTAASLTQTGMGLTSQYGLSVPSYDVGTDYVPRDMLAMIHEGERITPAAYNKPYTPRGEGSDTARLEAAVDRLSGAVARQQAALDKIASSTRRSADTLDVVTEGGSAMRTTV